LADPIFDSRDNAEGSTMTANTVETAGALALASKLFDIGTVDTVYRDVYLNRARAVLTGVFSIEEYRGIEQQKTDATAHDRPRSGAPRTDDPLVTSSKPFWTPPWTRRKQSRYRSAR
jgi:hypothetical protein